MKNRLVRPSVALAALVGLALAAVSLSSCVTGKSGPQPVTLKDTFKKDFRVGVAVNTGQATDSTIRSDNVNRTQEEVDKDIALVKTQFNQISPENDLKWALVQPYEGSNGYNFVPADAYMNFGVSNHMFIVGHTLVWHSQNPSWLFLATNGFPPADWKPGLPVSAPPRRGGGGGFGGGFGRGRGPAAAPATRDQLLARLHDHISTVVGRYKGKIQVWDVVNEALNDSTNATDTNWFHSSPWMTIIGPEVIVKAFQWAHEADPNAILRYNDFSVENPPKRARLIAMVKWLQSQHVPIGAIGLQTHANLTWPSAQLEDEALTDIEQLGLPIHITELDINGAQRGQRNQSADVNTVANLRGGPMVSAADQKLADEYTVLFNAFVKHHHSVKVVTFWGANDGVSWIGYGHPLLFDTNDLPKPAFDAVINTAAAQPK